jgi:pimeloyl-ACP methyl ester carboxylesterase
MWEPQFEVFSGGFKSCADLQATEYNSRVRGIFHHLDLKALLEMLEIQNASLVGGRGHSRAYSALECPEMVTAWCWSLLLLAGLFEGDPAASVEEQCGLQAGDFERAASWRSRWVDGPQRGPKKVDSSIRDLVRAMDRVALANEALGVGTRLSSDPPAIVRLEEISIPSLVLYGELDDPNVARAGDLLAENLRGAKKVIMAGTAHFPNLERSEIFNQVVLGFLSNPAFGSR